MFRPVLISGLDQALRQGAIQLHDPETLMQLRQFVRKANGREEGIGHDDDVFSAALAVEGLPYARRAFQYREAAANGPDVVRVESYRTRRRTDDD